MKTKIVIVDDHEVVRMGIKGLLAQHPRFDVVGEAGSARDAVDRVAQLQPDVVILDVRLPDGSGVDACRSITKKYPGTKVIMLTSFPDDDAVIESILAGAAGFVLKEIKGNSLVEAIDKVVKGDSLLDPGITGKVLDYMKNMNKDKGKFGEVLTAQERKILALVSEGKTNKEIGSELYLSERTVRNYLSRVMNKLRLSNRTQAAAYYIDHHKKK